MRPTIGDIINGTKQIIQEVVFPFVAEHSNHPEQPAVMENLLSLMVLLEHAAQRWDKAHLFLEEENRDLKKLVQKIAPLLCKEGQGEVETKSRADLPHPTSPYKGEEGQALWEANRKVKEQIAALLKTLPPNLRSSVEKSLAQLVEREKEWIKVGEVVWD